jgi:adenylyl cyclase-associated protein
MERSIAAPISRLTGIYRRLEAATSRLEDMATSVDSSHSSTVAVMSGSAAPPVNPSSTPSPAKTPAPEPLPPSIEDFENLMDNEVKAFVRASEKIGGLVEQQAWTLKSVSSKTNLILCFRLKPWLKPLPPNEHISM